MADKPTITRDDLEGFLRIKITTQAVYSKAAKAARDDDGSDVYRRVGLDLAERDALKASCAADRAYHDALDLYAAQGSE